MPPDISLEVGRGMRSARVVDSSELFDDVEVFRNHEQDSRRVLTFGAIQRQRRESYVSGRVVIQAAIDKEDREDCFDTRCAWAAPDIRPHVSSEGTDLTVTIPDC